MDYVKGCDIFGLSNFNLKRIANGKIEIEESLQNVLSYEVLSDILAEAKINFTDGNGKIIKGMPTAEIFVMTKKIDRKKYIIGVSVIKRIAGEPSGKTGPDAWFESSRDSVIEDKRFFAQGFEKEMEMFDQHMIEHFKSAVGSGQIREAEYQNKIISRAPGKKVLGIYLSSTAIFIAMIIVWGLIFKNFALGICFALCFTSCFAVVTNKTKSEEKDLSQTGL